MLKPCSCVQVSSKTLPDMTYDLYFCRLWVLERHQEADAEKRSSGAFLVNLGAVGWDNDRCKRIGYIAAVPFRFPYARSCILLIVGRYLLPRHSWVTMNFPGRTVPAHTHCSTTNKKEAAERERPPPKRCKMSGMLLKNMPAWTML